MMLDELAVYLAAESVGTVGTDLWKGRLPDQPDASIALYEPPSGVKPRLIDTLETRLLQVIARGAAGDYATPRASCETVYALLHGVHETVIDGATYFLIEAKQPPFSLGNDEKQRPMFTVNFTVMRFDPNRQPVTP